jgi:glycosyltransferase involved in cell wall biosynthesis
MAFEPDLHAWCFSVSPPVVDARTPEQIYAELNRLAADDDARLALGQAGREWVERHHGWRVAVDRQLAIYEELVKVRRGRAVVPG